MASRVDRLLMAAALTVLAAATTPARAVPVFNDDFDVPGNQLDLTRWTTEFGPSSFLGRTQLQNWVTGSGRFVVADGKAQLALETYNPTGFSLYGTHGKTLMSFQAAATTGYELSARIQLASLQPGLVYGLYLYGCGSDCANHHDELDIEIVTNYLHTPDSGQRSLVQLNRYADEPLGAGHGPVVELPLGFDPLAMHDWRIRWMPGQVSYSVDGMTLFSATSFVPQGPMQADIIAWGPGPEWAAAYSAALQPTGDPGLNQRFVAYVDAVTVSAVPEPAAWLLFAVGLAPLA